MAMMRGMFVVGALWCFASLVAGVVVEAEMKKPNNYPNFEFHEEDVEAAAAAVEEGAHDQFAKGHEFRGPLDASDRFGEHASFSAQDGVVYDARRDQQDVTYKMGEAEMRYDLREQAKKELAASREVRFTNVHHVDVAEEEVDKAAAAAAREGRSSRFFTPASDPDFAFRFAIPESAGDESKRSTYSQQFNFDNSDATNDPTATYGTTTPVLAAENEQRTAAKAGHGCANMYWAEHTKEWPAFFGVNTEVAQAFGTRAGQIYGTTTLLQALYDTRDDGYSQLLSHGTAALLNAYAMPNYGLRHDAVMDQFVGALASRTAAGVQAQKFSNANHAHGPTECLN